MSVNRGYRVALILSGILFVLLTVFSADLITRSQSLEPARIAWGGGNAYVFNLTLPRTVRWGWFVVDSDDVSGTVQNSLASRLTLSEDGKPLGPAHALESTVTQTGGGAFSHCQFGVGLLFSTSDNTDPRSNGRHYVVRYPIRLSPVVFLAAVTLLLLLWLPLVGREVRRSRPLMPVTGPVIPYQDGWVRPYLYWGLPLAALFFAGQIGFGEIVAYHEGLGSDGFIRGLPIILGFPDNSLTNHGLTAYDVGRVLPYTLIALLLRLLALSPSNGNIVLLFQGLGALEMLAILATVPYMARRLQISERGVAVSVAGLLLSAFSCKYIFYEAPMTDLSACTIGWFMSLSYLRQDRWTLFLLTLLGAFCWPIALYFGAMLLLFMGRKAEAVLPGHSRWAMAGRAPSVAMVGVAVFLIAVLAAGIVAVSTGGRHPYGSESLPAWNEPWGAPLNTFSLASLLILGGCGFYVLLDTVSWAEMLAWLRGLSMRRLLAVCGLVLAVALAIKWIASPTLPPPVAGTLLSFAYESVFQALMKPALFVVSGIALFGPLVIIVALCWGDICTVVRQEGFHMVILAALAFLIFLNACTRQSSFSLGFLLPYLAKGIDLRLQTFCLRRYQILLIATAALGFILSRLWMQIGSDFSTYNSIYPSSMNWTYYMVQAPLALVAILTFALIFRYRTRPEGAIS